MARRSLFCAEGGLSTAHAVAAANTADWPAVLDGDPGNDPAWHPIRGYLAAGGSGRPDFEVTLRDNDDELPPLANDPSRDNDRRVFLVSRCLRYPEHPRTVMELIEYAGGGHAYRDQSGQGGYNTGNAN
jgi:hypothetical protein